MKETSLHVLSKPSFSATKFDGQYWLFVRKQKFVSTLQFEQRD